MSDKKIPADFVIIDEGLQGVKKTSAIGRASVFFVVGLGFAAVSINLILSRAGFSPGSILIILIAVVLIYNGYSNVVEALKNPVFVVDPRNRLCGYWVKSDWYGETTKLNPEIKFSISYHQSKSSWTWEMHEEEGDSEYFIFESLDFTSKQSAKNDAKIFKRKFSEATGIEIG